MVQVCQGPFQFRSQIDSITHLVLILETRKMQNSKVRNSSSVVSVQHGCFHPCLTESELQLRDCKHSLDETVIWILGHLLRPQPVELLKLQGICHGELHVGNRSKQTERCTRSCREVAYQFETEAPCVWDRAAGYGVALLGLLPWLNLPFLYTHFLFIGMRRVSLCHCVLFSEFTRYGN